jgi:glutathione peroxidase
MPIIEKSRLFTVNSRLLGLALAIASVGTAATSVFDYVPLSIDGKPTPLSAYRGKVLLIVNVASQSGFTPQYAGLEWLYEHYRDQGLVVLAFPANDFGQEEPGSNEQIKQFSSEKYKVSFPLFAKISVAGEHVAPLYELLSDKQSNPAAGGPVRWNFTKFLVGRDGKIIARFEPDVDPKAPELVDGIEKALHVDAQKNAAAAR